MLDIPRARTTGPLPSAVPTTPAAPPAPTPAALTPATPTPSAAPAPDARVPVDGTGTQAIADSAHAADAPMPWDPKPAEALAEWEEVSSVDERDAECAKDDQRANADPRAEMQQMREDHQTQCAVDGLPPEQQAMYETLSQAATASGIPDAHRALTELARTGAFGRNPALLPALNQLATQETAPRLLNRDPNAANRMVGEMLRQLADQGAIQMDPTYDSCGAAVMEQQLAAQNPAAYVQMVADLASANRPATLPNGRTMDLPRYGLESAAQSDRSMASSIYQQALMATFSQNEASEGVSTEALQRMVNAQFPGHEAATFGQDQAAAATAALQEGSIAVLETGTGTKHAVNVLSNEGGTVKYADPTGAVVTLSAAEFQAQLVGAVLPKGSGITSTGADFLIGEGTFQASTTVGTTSGPRRR